MAKKTKEIKRARRAKGPRDLEQTPSPDIHYDERSTFLRICDHVAEKGIYAILLFVPLAFLPEAYWPFDVTRVTVLRVLTIIVFAAYLSRTAASREWKLVRPPAVTWPIIAYFIIYAISTIFSIAPDLSLYSGEGRNFGLVSLANMILLYLLVINIMTDRKQLMRCLDLFLISATIIALLGILQFYYHDSGWFKDHLFILSPMMAGRASSTFGNPDFLISFLVLPIPVAYGYLLKGRWIYALPFFITVFCFILSLPTRELGDYRIILLGILAFAMVPIIFMYLLKMSFHKYVPYVFLLCVILVMICLPALNVYDSRSKTVSFVKTHIAGEQNDRSQLAQIAWDTVGDHPVLGSGPNTFRDTFTQHVSLEYSQGKPDRREDKVHNSFVEAAATTGWLGFIAYSLMLVALVGYFLRWLLSNFGKPEFVFVGTILIAGLAYIGQSLSIFHTVVPYTFFWLLMAVGVGLSIADNARTKTLHFNISKTFSWCLVVLLLGIGCFGVFLSAKPLVANVYYYHGMKAMSKNDYSTAVSDYRASLDWNTSEGRYYWSYAAALLREAANSGDQDTIGHNCAEVQQIMDRAVDEEPQSAMTYYNRALFRRACESTSAPSDAVMADVYKCIELYPNGYLAYRLLAEYESERGNLAQAIAADEVALAIVPDYMGGMLRQGKNYLALGDQYKGNADSDKAQQQYEGAINVLKKAVDHDSGNATAHYLLGVAYEKAGHPEKAKTEYTQAISIMEELVKAKPKDKDAHYQLGLAYEGVGELDKAKEEYETVLQLDPNDREAIDALKRFEPGTASSGSP